jgi:maltose phosphorylase
MSNGFILDEWKIIENSFEPKTARFSESIFTLGNSHMGLRGFFEEEYSGDSLQGTYIAGVYYPDKTRVGWWKNGYPEFFAKIINSTNWIGINLALDGEKVDLAVSSFKNFRRELDMKQGKLTRSFTLISKDGKETDFVITRFLSMAEPNLACITVKATALNHHSVLTVTPYLDGDVKNEDANYGEKFWQKVNQEINQEYAFLTLKTKKTEFLVSTAMSIKVLVDTVPETFEKKLLQEHKYVGYEINIPLTAGKSVELQKFIAVCTSRDFEEITLEQVTVDKLQKAYEKGYTNLYQNHLQEMAKKWEDTDIIIKGDLKAQQGARYCIFQLNQSYNGKDPRLNIGPKGFSGEKYGGVTYWDTEALCLPFYLYTNEEIAKNLLFYRYYHLPQAKENASKLGLKGALYPMVTIDGQECHNEWEITFEEIHRNGAIAYAIYNYTSYTGDGSYLYNYGLEVLIEISRFWASRVSFNPRKDKYMILGVTGPNEYENNVNNNWYTNYMAAWTLEYTITSLNELKELNQEKYNNLRNNLSLEALELKKWNDILEKMYYPTVEELGIFEQNDLYMDKEQILAKDLPPEELPLNKHWSWDRILRSCFIKQADVIQAFYFLPERFDLECKKRNFDFYEPRTVHESSLSPCIHSIVASNIGYHDKAYELFLRSSRLDLENCNDDTDEGIHLTSMAGNWLAIVLGFAGIAVKNSKFTLDPYLPKAWESYSFKLTFRGRRLGITVCKDHIKIKQFSGDPLSIYVREKEYYSSKEKSLSIKLV